MAETTEAVEEKQQSATAQEDSKNTGAIC